MNIELFCVSIFLVYMLGTRSMLAFGTGLECELLL